MWFFRVHKANLMQLGVTNQVGMYSEMLCSLIKAIFESHTYDKSGYHECYFLCMERNSC